jgi:hypothetical protein
VTFTVHSSLLDRAPATFGLNVSAEGWTVLDNNASSTYTYATTPVPPFAFDSAPKASGKVGGEWTVTATVTGVPQGGSVAFGLTSPSEFVSGAGCTVSTDKQTLTCTPGGATGPFTVTFQAKLPGNPGEQHGSLTAAVVGDETRTASGAITE